MAKSTKKPNSFSKGMQSDLDPNVLPSESYKSAINARLITNEDNSFTLKSAEGNSLVKDFSQVTKKWTPSDFTNASGTRGTDTYNLSMIINGGDNSDTIAIKRYIKSITCNLTLTIGGSSTVYSRTYEIPKSLLLIGGNDAADYDAQLGQTFNDWYYAYLGFYHLINPVGPGLFESPGTTQEILNAQTILQHVDITFSNNTMEMTVYDTDNSVGISMSSVEKSKTFHTHYGHDVGNTPVNQIDKTLVLRQTIDGENFLYSFNAPTLSWSTTQDAGSDKHYTYAGGALGATGLNNQLPSPAGFASTDTPWYASGDTGGHFRYWSYDDSPVSFLFQVRREHDTNAVSYQEAATDSGTTSVSPKVSAMSYNTATVNWSIGTPDTINASYQIVGIESFSDYIVTLCHNPTTGLDKIIKSTVNADGTITASNCISLFGELDLGFASKRIIRTEKSEENEGYHRLYWTDGVNPLRAINLKDTSDYYLNLNSAEQLNIFTDKKLPEPNVVSVGTGGIVSCGAHSYCYRLISQDGKTSRISNITNPINIYRTEKSVQSHLISGGPLSGDNSVSTSSVKLQIDDIDSTYTTIQVINIKYTSKEGGIEANIISEGSISSSTYTYTHNGNETLVSVSISDLLANNISWTVCKDIAIKDNRMYAANLSNNISDITTSFRVKSYKYQNSTWYASDINNSMLYDEEFYSDGVINTYGIYTFSYIKGDSFSNALIPGAQSDGFATGEGVRVTFRTKRFDLGGIKYFQNSTTLNYASDATKAQTSYTENPVYGHNLGMTGPDGHYNNYSNPIFAENHKGYQRGEVYRFGILFYDKKGNPGFVSPIGDIRMPNNDTLYSTLNDSGAHITVGPDLQRTFKYCGSTSFSDSSCDLNGNTTVTHNSNSSIAQGLHVHGAGIPLGTRITTINSSTQFTISNAATVTQANTTLYFTDPTQDINGYALYPHFEVKLSDSTLNSIGGYSIVRVDRTEFDKRIIANGILTQTLCYEDNDSSQSMRHLNGFNGAAWGSSAEQHKTNLDSTFTFDSPEITLGNLNYNNYSTDKLEVNCRLDSVQNKYIDENLPGGMSASTSQPYFDALKTTDGNGYIAAGRFHPGVGSNMSNAADNYFQTITCSIYTVYTLNDDSIHAYTEKVKTNSWKSSKKLIGHAQRVAPSGVVNKSKMGYDSNGTGASGRDFHNKCLSQGVAYGQNGTAPFLYLGFPSEYTDEKMSLSTSNFHVDEPNAGLNVMTGCDTLFISLNKEQEEKFSMHHFALGTDENILQRTNATSTQYEMEIYNSKLYASITRNVSGSAYGGNEQSNFDNNVYISTGHANFNPTLSNKDEVFGGDTYINMYSFRKTHKEGDSYDNAWMMNAIAMVYPVESTVNVALRDGDYFGKTEPSQLPYREDDAYAYNQTYSCRNTTKTFVQKPFNFEQINNYSNMVAASNLKLSGDTVDAYSNFDAAEIHELDTDKGPIYSIFNLRGDIFTLQQSGVSKLSINPRVVVDNNDAAAVTVTTGTGRVIERSDYIDTKYGSQHYNNLAVTNTSAYWFDANMSSFCKLIYGKGIAVQDLGISTQNSNLFNHLKDLTIDDNPLDTTKGGICLYSDKRFNEISLSITHPTYTNNVHVTYNELSDCIVSKKYQMVVNSINHAGEVYTIGYLNLDGNGTLPINKLWLENSLGDSDKYYNSAITNCLDLTFVCNESVYSTKKFDKLVLYCSGNQNTQKFTNFTFTDSDTNTSFTNTGTGYKMANGKHIIPITSTDGTSKAEGQYLIINGIVPVGNYPVEVFGAIIHNRIVR